MRKIYCVIPVYNAEKTIKYTLESLNRQTISNCLSIIIVNDGSIDNTEQIIMDYCSNNNMLNVALYSKERGGAASARNFGLKQINFTEDCYISFIDADDFVDENYFYTLRALIEDHNVDIVVAGLTKDYDDKSVLLNPPFEGKVDSYKALSLLLEERYHPASIAKLYKGSVYKNVYFDEDVFVNEDALALVKSINNSKSVFFSCYAGYHANRKNSNASLTKTIRKSKMNIHILLGNLHVYQFSFSAYSKRQMKTLKTLSRNVLVSNYLTLCPRVEKYDNDIDIFNFIKRSIHKNNMIFLYRPYNFASFIKKYIYLLFRFRIYCFLMRQYIKFTM